MWAATVFSACIAAPVGANEQAAADVVTDTSSPASSSGSAAIVVIGTARSSLTSILRRVIDDTIICAAGTRRPRSCQDTVGWSGGALKWRQASQPTANPGVALTVPPSDLETIVLCCAALVCLQTIRSSSARTSWTCCSRRRAVPHSKSSRQKWVAMETVATALSLPRCTLAIVQRTISTKAMRPGFYWRPRNGYVPLHRTHNSYIVVLR